MGELTKEKPAPPAARLRSSDRREMLLEMAAHLAKTESIDAVTMELVAERCGVSRPLVYKHFANRDDMLAAVYRRESVRLTRTMKADVSAAESVEGMFRAMVRGALRGADDWSHLFDALRSVRSWNREVRHEQRERDDRTYRAFAERADEEYDLDPATGPSAVLLLLSLIDPVVREWRRAPTPERAVLLEETYMIIVTATLTRLAEGSAAPD